MPKGHHGARRAAARHIEPGHEPGRRGAGAFGALKIHHPVGRTKAQPGEGVHDHAQAVGAGERVAPAVGGVAIHGLQKGGQLGAAQHGLHLIGIGQRVGRRPGGQHSGMHHQQGLPRMRVRAGQRLLAHPGEQGLAVGGVQHRGQRVAPRRLARPCGSGQQVQVVVAQQAADRVAMAHAAAQHGGRIGPPVDQVAQQVNGVAAGRKADGVQQAAQGAVAALDIADAINSHGVVGRGWSVDFLPRWWWITPGAQQGAQQVAPFVRGPSWVPEIFMKRR